MLLSLIRLRPLILWDAEGGGAGGGSNDPPNPDNGAGDGSGGGEEKRTFIQKELDALFAARAKQAKESTLAEVLKELGVENLDGVKAALKAAKDAEAAQMTELEKAQKEAADLKARHEQAEKEKADILAQAQEKLLKVAVLAEAAKAGFNDPQDAWLYVDRAAIKAKEDDTFEGLDKAVEAVVKAKPYLVKAPQQLPGGGTPRREKGKPPGKDGQEGKDPPAAPTINF